VKRNYYNYYRVNKGSNCGINISRLFLPLFKLLKMFAYVGMVHRDIRESNISIKNGKLYLLDYGFACPKGIKTDFAGGICCASDKVLNNLENKKYSFPVQDGDDIFSLIRVITVVFNENIIKKLDKRS
jgi:serine/threonine protein kinase